LCTRTSFCLNPDKISAHATVFRLISDDSKLWETYGNTIRFLIVSENWSWISIHIRSQVRNVSDGSPTFPCRVAFGSAPIVTTIRAIPPLSMPANEGTASGVDQVGLGLSHRLPVYQFRCEWTLSCHYQLSVPLRLVHVRGTNHDAFFQAAVTRRTSSRKTGVLLTLHPLNIRFYCQELCQGVLQPCSAPALIANIADHSPTPFAPVTLFSHSTHISMLPNFSY
jgi:hypothetical protein